MKATEGWRTPKRFANCEAASKMQQLLECAAFSRLEEVRQMRLRLSLE